MLAWHPPLRLRLRRLSQILFDSALRIHSPYFSPSYSAIVPRSPDPLAAGVTEGSSSRGRWRRNAVHLSNDNSVMLPSSFGMTRWFRIATHVPCGGLTHHF